MSDFSTNLQLPYVMPAQAQKHVTVNEGLRRLDALCQANAVSKSVTVQPSGPADGAVYITPPGKTGADWDGAADWSIAHYADGAWQFIAPKEGWLVWVRDEDGLFAWTGAAWNAVDIVSKPAIAAAGGLTEDDVGTSGDKLALMSTANVWAGNQTFGAFAGDGSASGVRINAVGSLQTERDTAATVFHMLLYNPNGAVGSISTSGATTAFNTTSDYRLKENDAEIAGGLARLRTLRPIRFNFVSDAARRLDGFFAHEVAAAVPEAVTGEKDATQTIGVAHDAAGRVLGENLTEAETPPGAARWTATGTRPAYQAVDHSKLVPLLVAAVKELAGAVEALERRIVAKGEA